MPTPKTYSNDELTDPEKFFRGIIESVRDDTSGQRTIFNRLMKMYRSQYYADSDLFSGDEVNLEEEDTVTETNYLFSHVDTLVASITPPNPQVTVQAHRASLKDAAKYREALINRVFVKERLAQKLWKLAARATVWPRCFVKTLWSARARRPIFRVVNPHRVWFDVAAEEWEDIRWIVEVTTITKGEMKKRMRKKGKSVGKGGIYRSDAVDDAVFGKLPTWMKQESEDYSDELESSVQDAYKYAIIYEVYDLVEDKFYHFTEGCPKALVAADLPYRFIRNPFTPIVFNDNMTNLAGISDAELVYPSIEQKNELSSLKLAHVRASIPVPMVNESLLDEPEEFLATLEEGINPGEYVSFKGLPSVSAEAVITHAPMPTLSHDWNAMSGEIDANIMATLGVSDYQRGAIGSGDVATEFALAEGARKTRDARRQKVMYLVISSLAENVVNLFREYLAEGVTIPLSMDGADDVVEIGREELGFVLEDTEAEEDGFKGDDPWVWDVTALPYNASEANDIVQLKRLETFLPVLMQLAEAGHVDQRKIAEKMAELLNMAEILAEPQPTPPPAPPGMPGGEMGGGGVNGQIPGGGAGATMPGQPQGPPGMAAPQPGIPDAAGGAMSGGQVGVGTGAQSLA